MDDEVEGAEDGGFREIFERCGRETQKRRRRCIHHSLPSQQRRLPKVFRVFCDAFSAHGSDELSKDIEFRVQYSRV